MAATKCEIGNWFDYGVQQGATHMIVASDLFDYEDFPVFVKPSQDVNETYKQYTNGEKMLTVMEVYNLSQDKALQMDQRRAFNF
jgi:hypothetical protein